MILLLASNYRIIIILFYGEYLMLLVFNNSIRILIELALVFIYNINIYILNINIF